MQALVVSAQTVNPGFGGGYSIRDLGTVPGLPTEYGGVTFKAGATNTLLMGGKANGDQAGIYEIDVTRGTGNHLSGFSGAAVFFAPATGHADGGIDGGLSYGPDNVLFYTSYPDNGLNQIKAGANTIGRQINLTALNYDGSMGGLAFVPSGLPGAGRLKLLSFGSGKWYDTTISPDGNGTFNVAGPAHTLDLGGGPEGAFYVRAGNPGFADASVLVADYSEGIIFAFEIDSFGDPILATRRTFISGLPGATGAALDPVTGDFLFTSFGSEHLYVVGGFSVPAPAITITAPTNNASFGAPADILITTAVTSAGGAISSVDFFRGTNFVGSVATAPYSLFATAVPAGIHQLQAIAHDANGLHATSSVVQVTVTNVPNLLPAVTLINPAASLEIFACSTLVLAATASDPDGDVQKVEFFWGTTKLGETVVPPYRITVTNLSGGTNLLTAKATDDRSGSSVSSGVNLRVTAPPLHQLVPIINTNRQLECCFTGQEGSNYVFEAANNLSSPMQWQPINTNQSGSGTLRFLDPGSTNWPHRFYRTRQLGP